MDALVRRAFFRPRLRSRAVLTFGRFGTTLHSLAQFQRLARLQDLNDHPEGYYRPDEGSR